MNVLVVNNETKRIDGLKELLQGHTVSEITPFHITPEGVEKSDLILLIGNQKSTLVGQEAYFEKELELLRSTQKPIIGICLGLQIIAYAFEGFVGRMPMKQPGIKEVKVIGHDPLFGEKESFKIYSQHRWMVEIIDFPLVGLARSGDGWEIVKHATKKIYGFQFHPEVMEQNCTDGKWLFERVLNLTKTV